MVLKHELREARGRLETGKLPSVDNIPPELMKYGETETFMILSTQQLLESFAVLTLLLRNSLLAVRGVLTNCYRRGTVHKGMANY